MKQKSYVHEMRIAEALARKAGDVVLNLQKRAKITYKANDEGPVTDADLIADELILEGLVAEFPQDSLISEESFQDGIEVPSSGRTWFVDPIDGTADYIIGGDDYSVMIGLVIDGVAVLGCVYQPTTNKLWRTVSESCAEMVDAHGLISTLNVRNKMLDVEGPIVVVSKHHPSARIQQIALNHHVSKIIKKGSIGLKAAFIAEGLADVYVTRASKVKLWDTCAPEAILRAAGGMFLALNGSELRYDRGIVHTLGIAALNPACLPWLNAIRPALTAPIKRLG